VAFSAPAPNDIEARGGGSLYGPPLPGARPARGFARPDEEWPARRTDPCGLRQRTASPYRPCSDVADRATLCARPRRCAGRGACLYRVRRMRHAAQHLAALALTEDRSRSPFHRARRGADRGPSCAPFADLSIVQRARRGPKQDAEDRPQSTANYFRSGLPAGWAALASPPVIADDPPGAELSSHHSPARRGRRHGRLRRGRRPAGTSRDRPELSDAGQTASSRAGRDGRAGRVALAPPPGASSSRSAYGGRLGLRRTCFYRDLEGFDRPSVVEVLAQQQRSLQVAAGNAAGAPVRRGAGRVWWGRDRRRCFVEGGTGQLAVVGSRRAGLKLSPADDARPGVVDDAGPWRAHRPGCPSRFSPLERRAARSGARPGGTQLDGCYARPTWFGAAGQARVCPSTVGVAGARPRSGCSSGCRMKPLRRRSWATLFRPEVYWSSR